MREFFDKYKIWILSAAGVLLAAAITIILVFALPKEEVDDAALSDVSFAVSAQNEPVSVPSDSTPSDSAPEQPPESQEPEQVISPLVISSPEKLDTTVSQSHFAITGTSDPSIELLMNGEPVERLEGGEFTVDVELAPGAEIENVTPEDKSDTQKAL